ncbi:MAG TPA: hypothetical protein PLA02_06950 [Brevefilum fermentans]|jgi:hypothetical protein|nr:hypothetical protein [Chloroflexota bacterium]OQB86804.1 MAG: Neutral ceramidase precursor [Chloroflexi bacterium ADurb.Bin120]HOM66600.1 hypothetical protein [Brevefilum fermentans]HPX96116.1 hypothetical protein [Brevefilum fermentans]HQA28943.1 hypothetical protein [Brevefilum fermentans]
MSETGSLKVGFARQIINPPTGILTIGFGDRFKGNRGVHDDLTATAMVLALGDQQVGIVALDLLAVHEDFTRELENFCGIPLLLCCAHTHSAPMSFSSNPLRTKVKRYAETLREKIILAVDQARGQLQPASLFWGEGNVDIAVNRRERLPDGRVEIGVNPDGPVDRRVAVIEARSEEGEVLGRVINMQCHATVMGPENLLVSADWVGAMRRQLEDASGGLTVYIQGATGDLNPKLNVGNDFENISRLGGEAYGSISEILTRLQYIQVDRLTHLRSDVMIPLQGTEGMKKPAKTYREVAKTVGLPPFLADIALEFLYPWKTRLELYQGAWAFPIQENLLDLGGLVLMSMGMEVFNQIGQEARCFFEGKAAVFGSLVNSCYGYLPTRAEYELGGYEVDMSWKIYRMPGPMPANADQLALEGLERLKTKLD